MSDPVARLNAALEGRHALEREGGPWQLRFLNLPFRSALAQFYPPNATTMMRSPQ